PSTTPSTTTSSTPTTPATLPEGVVLRRGAKGVEVRQVQEALVALGYSTTIDGKFGPATAQAVKSFQASSGLTDDGVVGPATLSALSAAVNGTERLARARPSARAARQAPRPRSQPIQGVGWVSWIPIREQEANRPAGSL